MHRNELECYLNDMLAINSIQDTTFNGCQIEGKTEISTIVTGVSANLELINKAVLMNADAIIVHHGYFWKKDTPAIRRVLHNRVKMILVNNINLFSYHLPLDVHAHYGNNIQLSQLLGLTYIKEIELQDCVTAVMCSGSSIDNCIYKLIEKIAFVLQRQPLVIHGGSKNCHKIGICTGAAQNFIDQISESGCDTYISGEVSERTYHLAKELGINYIAAGHHATERYGVWSLGNHLREKFSLNHYFIDIDNPI